MNSTSSCRPRHRRWKIPIAMLAASAAFVGGQALAPTPAVAMFSNGPGACQFWIDCITQEETGGGGGGGAVAPGGGSVTPGGGDIEANPETIVVEEECQRSNVVCISVPVGGRGGGNPQNDRDEIKRHDGGPYRGHPSCKRPSTGLEADVCHPKKDKKDKKEPKKKPKTALEVALDHAKWCTDLGQEIKSLELLRNQVANSTMRDRDMDWTREPDPAQAKKETLDEIRELIKMEEKQFSDECAATSV